MKKRSIILLTNFLILMQDHVGWYPEKILVEAGLNRKERRKVMNYFESDRISRNYRRRLPKNENIT